MMVSFPRNARLSRSKSCAWSSSLLTIERRRKLQFSITETAGVHLHDANTVATGLSTGICAVLPNGERGFTQAPRACGSCDMAMPNRNALFAIKVRPCFARGSALHRNKFPPSQSPRRTRVSTNGIAGSMPELLHRHQIRRIPPSAQRANQPNRRAQSAPQ